MSDQTNNIAADNTVSGQGVLPKQNNLPGQNEAPGDNVTPEYLLYLIEKLADDTDYLKQALATMGSLSLAPSASFGGDAPAATAQGVAEIVACRETTNQQILKLYEKMYDDLKGTSALGSNLELLISKTFDMISEDEDSDARLDVYNALIGTLTHLGR